MTSHANLFEYTHPLISYHGTRHYTYIQPIVCDSPTPHCRNNNIVLFLQSCVLLWLGHLHTKKVTSNHELWRAKECPDLHSQAWHKRDNCLTPYMDATWMHISIVADEFYIPQNYLHCKTHSLKKSVLHLKQTGLYCHYT